MVWIGLLKISTSVMLTKLTSMQKYVFIIERNFRVHER